MLINLAVKNFKSFKDRTVFSMRAGSYKRFPSHVVEQNGRQVLRSGFLFGANASGKSCFVQALHFLGCVVDDGLSSVSLDKLHFRITKQREDVGIIEVSFLSEGRCYSYGIAVSYSKSVILGEWLNFIRANDTEKCIFSRELAGGECRIVTDCEIRGDEKDLFDVCSRAFTNAKMAGKTFIDDFYSHMPTRGSSEYFKHIQVARDWFHRLIVIFPDSTYGGMDRYIKNPIMRTSLGDLLHHFDTGIERLNKEPVELDRVVATVPAEVRDKMKSQLIEQLTSSGHPDAASIEIEGSTYLVNYKDGELIANKLVADHGNKEDPFELSDESDGTRRLYDLLPLNRVVGRDHVIVIDELDRSLHTQATREFVKLFFKASSGACSQLIATTHDHDIIDLNLLRQDEIWFVERQKDHSTRLFSLSQFKERFDKDVEKEYMLGKYGAVPLFRMLESPQED